MQNTIFEVWRNISGSGMLLALYILAVVFLLYTEKEKYKRILFVFIPGFWLIVLFLPVTYRLIAEWIDEELYYRFFWMLPVTATIAYSLAKGIGLCSGRTKKYAVIGSLLLVMLCGDFVYNNSRYSIAENPYHVPESVVEICDSIHIEGREVMAVFPENLMQYVRQYDSTVCMPYGRDTLVAGWKIDHALRSEMEAEVLDGKRLGSEAWDALCVYIIIPEDKAYEGDLVADLADQGYIWKDTICGYRLFYNEFMLF